MFKKPPYVFLPAAEFLAEVITHREGEERSKWVTDFAIQLAKGKGKDSFAQELLIDSARKLNENNTRTRRSRAKAELIAEGNKNPSRAEINERMVEMYGEDEDITAAAAIRDGVEESTTGCNPLTADGDIREDSQDLHDGSDAAQMESGTSANNSGERGTPGIERTSAPLPSPTTSKPKTDPKPTKKAKAEVKPEEQKYPHGEFENIMLTTREYTQLCERLDNADSLIEEADQYFEAQPDKKKKYKSHYAMLLNWDRRRKEFEAPAKVQRFKTIDDINQERIAKAKREIYEMFHPGESKAV